MGTWGGGPAAYSGYMGQGGMGTWRRGSSCLQLVHEGRHMWGQGSTYLQWVRGGQGGQLLSGYMGAGVQLLTVGTWGQGV